MGKNICHECGQPLDSPIQKHTNEDCCKYRAKLFMKGLENAVITFSIADKSVAFLNVPLDYPKVWLVFKVQVHKRGQEVI